MIFRNASVLVVDDTRANLRLLTEILTEQNYMVRPVPDGELAIAAVHADPPDIILLDIMMQGVSGYEVCEKLKADERTCDIPVIFISAKNEVFDKVRAFSLGGVDYITKPFHADEVLARVENHLMLRNLQKRLEEKNEALTEALEQLRATQNQLILQEKMAALGHLVAGVAHEINTPMGAIRASISNISNALNASVQELPRLFQQLSPERQTDFFTLIRAALNCRKNFSSREARKTRRKLRTELEARQINDAEFVSNTLANMGICQDISPYLSLLREKNNTLILRTAYNLFVQENNSRNIMTAVERASKVVFALKSYARHDDSGRMTTAKVTEGLDVVLTLYHNHLKHGIDVIREYDDVPEIHCYPDELNQVWTNLIHNAIHAMGGKGELSIAVSEQDGQLVIRITDSGSGIPEAVQNRIFEPFFTTKASGEGSGLGLDIVWKIIERHGGNIKVNSQPGRTTFSIFLPLNHPEII